MQGDIGIEDVVNPLASSISPSELKLSSQMASGNAVFSAAMHAKQDDVDHGQASKKLLITVPMDNVWDTLVSKKEHRDPFRRYDTFLGDFSLQQYGRHQLVRIQLRSMLYYKFEELIPHLGELIDFFQGKYLTWDTVSLPAKGEHFDFARILNLAGYEPKKKSKSWMKQFLGLN